MWNILKYKNMRYFYNSKLHFASVFLLFFYYICPKTWLEYFQCSKKKKHWASFNYCFMPLSERHLLLVNQIFRYCTYKNGWFLPFRLSAWYMFSFVHQKFKTYLPVFFFFRITPEKYDSLYYLPVITVEWSTDTRNHVSVLLLTKKFKGYSQVCLPASELSRAQHPLCKLSWDFAVQEFSIWFVPMDQCYQ